VSAGPRRLIVEADGGSRNNPGPAGYGAVVLDASTGELLREAFDYLGVATNNVAEYQGLLAGLRAARDLDAHARVEVRMDSRLVIEQMSGRWQVKHPDLRPLAREAASLVASFGPGQVTFTWIPRERNKRADALANKAMDAGTGQGGKARPSGRAEAWVSGAAVAGLAEPASPVAPVEASSSPGSARNRLVGWGPQLDATKMLLTRHGVTAFTLEKRFCGVSDPPLAEPGRVQAKALAERLDGAGVDAIVSSPLARCRETAAIIAAALAVPVYYDDDLRETDFGAWEGLTFATVEERWPQELAMWLADTSISPPGGESYTSLQFRTVAAQQRIMNRYRSQTVFVVTHSRPVATFVASALGAPVSSLYRLHVDNAGLTRVDYYADGLPVLRVFNDTSHLR
jgi:probable phosphoglycerate mutase